MRGALAPSSRRLTRTHTEGAVGAVLSILYARLQQPRRVPVSGLLGERAEASGEGEASKLRAPGEGGRDREPLRAHCRRRSERLAADPTLGQALEQTITRDSGVASAAQATRGR